MLDSLPPREIADEELVALNESDAVSYVAPVDGRESATHAGLVVVTDEWAVGLALVDDGWEAVHRVTEYDDRFDALRECEGPVQAVLGKDSQPAGE